MRVSTQTAATDPHSGKIDMGLITTGRSATDRDAVARVAEELRSLFAARAGQKLTVGQIRQMIQTVYREGQGQGQGNAPGDRDRDRDGSSSLANVSMAEVEEAVREMATEGSVQYVERSQTVIIRG